MGCKRVSIIQAIPRPSVEKCAINNAGVVQPVKNCLHLRLRAPTNACNVGSVTRDARTRENPQHVTFYASDEMSKWVNCFLFHDRDVGASFDFLASPQRPFTKGVHFAEHLNGEMDLSEYASANPRSKNQTVTNRKRLPPQYFWIYQAQFMRLMPLMNELCK
jgi:hypothetical protein